MAKPIVTQEQVNEVANELAAAGDDPTILNVQAKIGAGSFTTIKRYLDVWKQQRQAQPVIAIPQTLAERGAALVRDLWQVASELADEQITEVRSTARAEIAAARQAQADAEAVIEQVEQEIETLREQVATRDQELDTLQQELNQTRNDLSGAQARAVELERQNAELRADLERAQAGGRAEVERLAGEMAALRAHVDRALERKT